VGRNFRIILPADYRLDRLELHSGIRAEAFVRWVSLAGVVLRPDDHRRPLEGLNGSSQASTRSVRHHPSRVGIKCSDIPAAWRACTAPSVRQLW
jgi:hypothetical protein